MSYRQVITVSYINFFNSDGSNVPWTACERRGRRNRTLAVRRSLMRGAPFGQDARVKQVAKLLGLESPLRTRGRPKKENEPSQIAEKVACPLFASCGRSPGCRRAERRCVSDGLARQAVAYLAGAVADRVVGWSLPWLFSSSRRAMRALARSVEDMPASCFRCSGVKLATTTRTHLALAR